MAAEGTQTQYDAASREILTRFQQLLQKDPCLLDGVANLLHIATLNGQSAIVEEMLSINPRLARSMDSQNSTALHIAAEQGNLEITKILVRVAPEVCWWRDCHGMNPVHVAAVNGHVNILLELVQGDLSPAMEKLDRGQTVLHLCVKHHQRGALEFFVDSLPRSFVETKNDDGETLLHLAAGYHEVEMMSLLTKKTGIDEKSRDWMGRTAVNVVNKNPGSREMNRFFLMSIWNNMPLEFVQKTRDGIMVVMVLITTMAFQAAVSPPGGVWQDDSSAHKAGETVMASSRPKIFNNFVRANTTAFISSLISIFLVTSGGGSMNYFVLASVVYATWVSMGSIAAEVPKGHVAVYVGDNEKRRFVIPVTYLNHPSFEEFLFQAEEEYGFYHPICGLTIHCCEELFTDFISGLSRT